VAEGFLKKLPIGAALRESLAEGYGTGRLVSDAQSGLVVALIAIPLGMALAIASGVSPLYGLVTVVLGGGITAVLGGSRFQVTGPTAAFVALLLPVVLKHGLGGLLLAGLICGCLLVLYGVLGLGRAIEYVPHPVVTGFTSGIALVIASIQIKDFCGLAFHATPEHFYERMLEIVNAFPTMKFNELGAGLGTLALIGIFGKVTKRIPAPILALFSMAGLAALLSHFWPEWAVSSIGSRFHYSLDGQIFPGIPRNFPGFAWPWQRMEEGGAAFEMDWSHVRAIFPAALSISLLGAVESLLSAVVADGMTRKRHNPDAELIALGVANIVCPFFGGIPATGAIARTATNIRFGGTSPVASISHAIIVFFTLLIAAPMAAYLPMASLAALLLVVAWNMSEKEHFFYILKIGRWGDRIVLLACFGLTVFIDMTVGVTAGMVIAAFFLIKRVGELGEASVFEPSSSKKLGLKLPPDAMVYQVSGPMLFGAAH
jgi:SulP family sulfate permease